MDTDEFLEHYGVKGMRWGVVRRRGSNGRVEPHADALTAKEHAKTVKKSGTQALSNAQLKELTKRMQLEADFARLSNETKQVKQGQKVVKDLINTGRTVNDVIAFVNSPAGKLIRKQFTRA